MTPTANSVLISPLTNKPHPTLVGVSRLSFADGHDKLNHNVFRYPAKFHPPVARSLIERFSPEGSTVLDPFCGSGTTLVEGLIAGRSVVGTDVDPLAAMISSAKIRRFDHDRVDFATVRLKERIGAMREADASLWGPFDKDIDEDAYGAALEPLGAHVPPLPRMAHWFRRRVVIELAAIRAVVASETDPRVRGFLELCFASIIRNSSNADPVPVSGLEVTSHMRRKEEAGRTIDPYTLFINALSKTAAAMRAFGDARQGGATGRAAVADARHLSILGTGQVDTVVTSPPYLMAVDYYRRHTLEMYWLGLTTGTSDRLEILPRYIGRDRVGLQHAGDAAGHGAAVARKRLASFKSLRSERSRAFSHYCASMDQVFGRMREIVRPGGNIVFVIGDVRFAGVPISMVDLLTELAEPHLALVERLWYPLANRFMSYSRKNEADINADHVLVFRRKN